MLTTSLGTLYVQRLPSAQKHLHSSHTKAARTMRPGLIAFSILNTM